MRVAGVLFGSVALHVAVLLLLARIVSQPEEHRESVPRVEITIEPLMADPNPIDVAIVELHDEPPQPAIAATTRHDVVVERHDTGGSIAAAASTGSTIAGSSREHSAGSELFHHMRGADLRPAQDVMQQIAETGERPSAPRRTGRVERAPNGAEVIHDAVTEIRIEGDGTAHLHDKPDIDVQYRLPIHPDIVRDVKDFGRVVTEWYADPYAGTRFGRTQDLAPHLQAVPGQCDSWGDVMCDDANAPGAEKHARETASGAGVPIIGGKLDITAYLMRKLHVGDAYASRKLKLLDDTREERVAHGTEYRAEQLARSAELMRVSLSRLWAATADPQARRTVLFELWDDCAEGEGPLGEAGQRARTQVIGWIRGHLPATGPDAYTADETAAFNARRASKQAFEPY